MACVCAVSKARQSWAWHTKINLTDCMPADGAMRQHFWSRSCSNHCLIALGPFCKDQSDALQGSEFVLLGAKSCVP